MDDKELLKLTPGELVDLGICPTCFDRKHNGALYGDNSDKLIYEDKDIECFFVGNPRADGHMCISSINHYHIQLIPRYSYEKRGSKNFTKERHARNPKNENVEEIIIHKLLHLKLYPLDQLTEGLIDGHYNVDTSEYNTIYTQFMTMLEQTVEELTKCFLLQYGDDKELSYGRCKTMKSFNELYDGLKTLK